MIDPQMSLQDLSREYRPRISKNDLTSFEGEVYFTQVSVKILINFRVCEMDSQCHRTTSTALDALAVPARARP